MNTSRQRLSARDYKHGGRRSRFDLNRYRQFGAGLAVGLLVALAVFVLDHRSRPTDTRVVSKPGADKEVPPQVPAEAPAEQYDFYEVLPKSGVIVPGQQRDARKNRPAAR